MRYVLGTESEDMAFSGDAVDYGPSGALHAVDTESAQFRSGRALAFAVCGAAVRVWEDRPFEPTTADEVDPTCAAVTTKQATATGEQTAVTSKK
ncbi:MAG TPA: hypothetical protein VE441_05250 [Mycobacterium sp.]|jgi:hypothetical protein|nr:hypothetical protein [Mycobacterium sp.]